jgi:hypothetical protein
MFSLGLNIYQFRKARAIERGPDLKIDKVKTIADIEAYLDTISPEYLAEVQSLSKSYDIPSWGCGPSSYALAKIINKKFFNNELIIDATYNENESYQIIQRFSFVKDKTYNDSYKVTDHSWIEIYMGNTFLFIDPTIGQFGTYNKIVYETFQVGDPIISDTLSKKYNIMDVRFAILMKKVVNRVPRDQEPYPGATIDLSSMDYYTQVLQDRNTVNDGTEPESWKDWTTKLLQQFQ